MEIRPLILRYGGDIELALRSPLQGRRVGGPRRRPAVPSATQSRHRDLGAAAQENMGCMIELAFAQARLGIGYGTVAQI